MVLVATTTTTSATLCAACTFPGLIHVISVATGDGVALKTHYGVRQILPFVGFDPGLYPASAQQKNEWDQG